MISSSCVVKLSRPIMQLLTRTTADEPDRVALIAHDDAQIYSALVLRSLFHEWSLRSTGLQHAPPNWHFDFSARAPTSATHEPPPPPQEPPFP